jgi:hypothetical protein
LEEYVASIFRAEEYAREKTTIKQTAKRAFGLRKSGIIEKQKGFRTVMFLCWFLAWLTLLP